MAFILHAAMVLLLMGTLVLWLSFDVGAFAVEKKNVKTDRRRRFSHQRRLAATVTTADQEDEYTTRKITLSKPMGLLMEEVKENEAKGVLICDMTNPLTQAMKREADLDICIGDELVQIDDLRVDHLTFDQVMTLLVNSADPMNLYFRRKRNHVAVCFLPSGVSIACPPGTPLKPLAAQARCNILYSCSQGDCTTCEQSLSVPGKDQTFVRPCVARVPEGNSRITIADSDSFLFGIAPPGL